jgi:hypothetical protein
VRREEGRRRGGGRRRKEVTGTEILKILSSDALFRHKYFNRSHARLPK